MCFSIIIMPMAQVSCPCYILTTQTNYVGMNTKKYDSDNPNFHKEYILPKFAQSKLQKKTTINNLIQEDRTTRNTILLPTYESYSVEIY